MYFKPFNLSCKARRLGATALAGAVATLAPATAFAQIDTIIVTSQKRAQDLQSVPASISAYGEDTLNDIGAADFSELAESIPGVELRNAQAGLGSIAIRGIAELNQGNLTGGTGSAVGFYLDDMPLTMAGILPDVKSFDMERVEVLRGPQGTLYGEGSLAGTVRLIANKPDAENFGAKIDATYGATEGGDPLTQINGMVNIPLIEDTLAFRAVGFYEDAGGYVDNPLISGEPTLTDANDSETIGGRFSLRYTPTDRLTATATVLVSNAERGSRNQGTEDFINTLSVAASNEDDLQAYNATIEYDFGFAEFVSSTSYFDRESTGIIDQGGLVPGVNFVFGLVMVPITATGIFIDQSITSEAFSQELRLVSTNDGPFQWTVGAFYKSQEFTFDFASDGVPTVPNSVWAGIDAGVFGGLLGTDVGFTNTSEGETEQFAVFGEASYDITDRLQLLAGVRVFQEDRESSSSFDGVFPGLQALLAGVTPGDPTFPIPSTFGSDGDDNLVNPRITATYQLSDDVITYASFAQGFRSGGQNDLFIFVPGSTQSDYDSETLRSYELGLKSTILDGRARFNAAAFYMDWEDLQAVVGEGTGGIGEAVGNIGEASSIGLDVEFAAEILEGLDFTLAATVLEAKTESDTAVADPSGGGAFIVEEGARIPRTAELTLSSALQYRFPITESLGGFGRISYSHVGDATTNLARSVTQPDQDEVPSYDIVNLRFGIEEERWQLYAFVENAFDETILYFSEASPDLGTGENRYSLGRPRTMGINLRAEF